MRISSSVPLRIFTPSFADADNTNAQNLTVKEIVSRLPEELFRITMLCIGDPDPRIAARRNTHLLRYRKHGNTPRLLSQCLLSRPHIYFFPRCGPFDYFFFECRKRLPIRVALVSYIVSMVTEELANGFIGRSIREGDSIVGNSRFVSRSVQERFGCEVRTIYDGVDTRFFFNEQRKAREKLVVMYAGSFRPLKRVEMVIAQAARFPNAEFRLTGRGETEGLCRRLVGQHGCANVHFLGHLTQEELGREMRNSDLFLFPSIQEGHPQVLIQAAASGLPCIAMNAYRPDSVIHGETGFLVNSDSELEESLNVLLSSPGLRHSMSEAAVAHASLFQWKQSAEQWASVFQNVAGRVPSEVQCA
jgi:glycosyltransferase involved in cell wall biosynthesis